MAVYNNCVTRRIQSGLALTDFWPLCIMHKYAFVAMALLSLAFAADAAAQSAVSDTTPSIGRAKPGLFKRIIGNQKKGHAALDPHERIERVETPQHPIDRAPPA